MGVRHTYTKIRIWDICCLFGALYHLHLPEILLSKQCRQLETLRTVFGTVLFLGPPLRIFWAPSLNYQVLYFLCEESQEMFTHISAWAEKGPSSLMG